MLKVAHTLADQIRLEYARDKVQDNLIEAE